MSIDKLGLYNLALVQGLGERPIDSLTEDSVARRALDAIWTAGNGTLPFVRSCLERGYWTFATRSVKIDHDTTVSLHFGYAYSFPVPSDFVKLTQIATDEYFRSILNDYEFEGTTHIYADVDPLYLRFVSDDPSYGGNLAAWPNAFVDYVAHDLAFRSGTAISSRADSKILEDKAERYLKIARSNVAQQQPVRFPPIGSWASARLGRVGISTRRDGGSRTQLIG